MAKWFKALDFTIGGLYHPGRRVRLLDLTSTSFIMFNLSCVFSVTDVYAKI